jgi:hypothetical protein
LKFLNINIYFIMKVSNLYRTRIQKYIRISYEGVWKKYIDI